MSKPNKASTLAEQVAVKKSTENEYVSLFYPDKMGNAANIAYGGCTIAMGVSAAYQTVGPQYHAYSINGNYLGPATDENLLFAKVTALRDTRTFATRLVEISQEQDNGTRRKCAVMIADFQVQEPASLLTYTTPPNHKYGKVESCPTREEMNEAMLKVGKITNKQAHIQSTVFGLMARFFEGKAVPESIFSQNLYGIAKDTPTTQDHIAFVQRTSADWVRSKAPLTTEGDHVAGLIFWMDGAISFLPLSHNHMFLEDAGACSSLDFSLRIFSNRIDLSKWHFKEMTTVHGSEGRTYSEARAWDEEGNMVACMTQQSILRPRPAPKPKAAL